MTSDALFSPCRTWRYALLRQWDTRKPRAVFVGLNPSTADETQDDPTIRRCIGFARRWDCGSVMMLNLFAFRATNPRRLREAADPVGPDNDRVIREQVALARGFAPVGPIVAAWGVNGVLIDRDKVVLPLLGATVCVGTTKDGHPRHPLYVRGDEPLVPYTGEQLAVAA